MGVLIVGRHENRNSSHILVNEHLSAGYHAISLIKGPEGGLEPGYYKIEVTAGDWQTYGFILKED